MPELLPTACRPKPKTPCPQQATLRLTSICCPCLLWPDNRRLQAPPGTELPAVSGGKDHQAPLLLKEDSMKLAPEAAPELPGLHILHW
ncbi:unnamed protein product [Caretta caretta]